jgi:hypothetical protein
VEPIITAGAYCDSGPVCTLAVDSDHLDCLRVMRCLDIVGPCAAVVDNRQRGRVVELQPLDGEREDESSVKVPSTRSPEMES